MSKLALVMVVAATVTLGSRPALAAPPSTLVVDDDGKQCAQADFSSIQAAVDAAAPGTRIRVCPGLYPESVTVATAVELRGDPDAVAAVDCFQATLLEPAADRYAIVDPPDGAAHTFTLAADGVDVSGLVVQGGTRAVTTSADHSGYRVHHNLITTHTVTAVTFRSNGQLASSVDHNCMRDDGWGVANEFLPLVNARMHHNSTFRIANYAYEQTSFCPEFLQTGRFDACAETRVGMTDVVFDHNVSSGDAVGFRLTSSTSTRLFENTVTSARVGIRLFGSNQDLQLVENHFQVRQTGVARQTTPPIASNFEALIEENTIIGAPGTGAGMGIGAGGLKDSRILDNRITGFAGEGLVLLADNTHNLVRGNTITDNGSNGVRVATGATGNTFEANEMLGNGHLIPGTVDAWDDARALNQWHNNVCLTDNPPGSICGIG